MAGSGRLTMRDVAREAQVSVFTVSVVLNGKGEAHRIGPATRERVLETARRLKYRHNLHARHLRTGKSETVGVLAWALGQGVSLTKLHALEAAIRERGYRTLLRYRHPAELNGVQLGFAQEFASGAVEGVLVLNSGLDYPGPLGELIETGIPVVSLEPLEGVPADVVTVDRMAGAYLLTKHLLELGHRRICLLGGRPAAPQSAERHLGYRQALAEHGCPGEEPIFVRPSTGDDEGYCVCAYEAARELLTRRPPPTAVFCSNDRYAFGVMRALAEAGVRIPEEMAVVGFDDIEMAAFAPVPLTTVAQPVREQAAQAVALLFERIERPDEDRPPQVVRLKPRLVVRASCGAALAGRGRRNENWEVPCVRPEGWLPSMTEGGFR
ncbi:MAG: LacI family DNA-binding transcriptional regulator [Armatimonadetes bacterium]|nr:LacI family DNA-binding transcriptional regulator [Armatimonadota bacterium]